MLAVYAIEMWNGWHVDTIVCPVRLYRGQGQHAASGREPSAFSHNQKL